MRARAARPSWAWIPWYPNWQDLHARASYAGLQGIEEAVAAAVTRARATASEGPLPGQAAISGGIEVVCASRA
jgi:hypothetical protein